MPSMFTVRTSFAFCLALLAYESRAETLPASLQTFFSRYCTDCHVGDAAEAGLDLDSLGTDLADPATFAVWERIYDRTHDGEMPPEDADPPSKQHAAAFINLLQPALIKAHASAKGTVMRRLNRREYQNTMNDLFGTNLDLESMLPADGLSHEFDNVGEALSVSMVHLQRYIDAADSVINAAVARTTQPPKPIRIATGYAQTREGEKHIGSAWKQLVDGSVVFFRGGGYPTGMLRTASARKAGKYRIQITAYAYQSDAPITVAVGATTFKRGAEKPTFGYYSFPPDQPTTIELEAYFDENYMLDLTPWGINDPAGEIRRNGVDQYRGPGVAFKEVHFEGPLVEQFPSTGHHLLFDGLDRKEVEPSNPSAKTKSWYMPTFKIESNDRNDAKKTLQRIATRAFRRPVAEDDIELYLDLFDQQFKETQDFESAILSAAAAIFCSPDFLYLKEPNGWLDDYAIASRLSYFLTRTSPDDLLLQSAARGELSTKPAALLAHVSRLLNGKRFDRFVVDFTDAWLNLRDIDFTSPDKNLFPEFDSFLQHSMLEETRHFFRVLVEENLGVTNIVKSDFAMLNNRLASHYGLPEVTSPEVKKITLPADSVRGGFLSQASILKVSANGTNTSPVVRGVWVVERILGESPAPPPPGINGVEPDIRGATTLRELLAKHRDLDSCKACHQMIDPPGFALESFDPIGGWRDHFRSLGDGEKANVLVNGRKVRWKVGPDVDPSGQLADGRPFRGFQEFRDLLAAGPDKLAYAFAEKLLTFASGRRLGFSDRSTLKKIVQSSRAKGHGVRDLIELVVLSDAFRRK